MLNELEWCSLEAKEAAVRITLLYKMSRHQIDIDTDLYLRIDPAQYRAKLKLGMAMTTDIDL